MKRRDEEYLLHLIAGTDPLTAMAALPDEPDDEPPRQGPACTCGMLAALVVGALVWWLLV